MPDVSIPAVDADIPGWVSIPATGSPWPGVVVIHDAFGMSPDVRRQCDWLSGAGFLAVAPDLYSHGRKLACIRAVFADLRARQGRTFDDVEAARAWLAGRDDCTGRVGVIGYCMGGGFSLLLAPGHGFAASSPNYGQVPDDVEQLLAGACPVVASFGGRDRTLKGAAAKLQRALDTNGVANDVKEYPDAGHSFLNDHRGGLGVIMRVLGPLLGAGYDEEAATDARARIAAFFDQHLRSA